ncbi:MAG TPA: hypothetical protein VNY24_02205 [Candidatus Acidoferrales bacterium]|jgi:hypothetical protein|nr:hypothetical protein [Candidatus Acidoferrales bacterium]
MSESLEAQIKSFVSRLNGLIRRGHQVRDALVKNSADPAAIVATRAWQEECGVAINQLSGGSKAHWLARSFSEAFLMRSAKGNAMEGAAPQAIVQRLLDVLTQGVTALSREGSGPVIIASENVPPRRFEFVHNSELRQILEQAYTDGRRAMEQGEYDLAMRTSCGILEAIVTDALEHKGLSELATSNVPAGKIADWSFETRLAVAEKGGLIRGGCARLPAVARAYRDQGDNGATVTVSEREARLAGQVLNVVMRDLNPGR